MDFKNTIIIMTSNIGAEMLKKQGSIGFKSQAEEVTYQSMKERLLDEVKKTFKPEFIKQGRRYNRIQVAYERRP